MCRGCWESYESPTELPENHSEIIERIETLYATDGCIVGGPLHVELEDENIDLNWVPWNGRGSYSEEAMANAQAVADLMIPLSLDHRSAVVAKWRGYF